MDPFNAIGNFAIGLIRTGKIQGWIKLAASCAATAFVTFFGIFGLSLTAALQSGTLAGQAIALSLGYASVAMAISVLSLWLRSPLTKGIPILYPGRIDAARLDTLEKEGTVFDPNEKR